MSSNKYEQDENKFLILLQNTPADDYEELIEECAPVFFSSIPSVESRKILLRRLVRNYLTKCFAEQEEFFLTAQDIERCGAINDPLLKRVFYCLLVQSRLHPHKNGWVELDWPNILTIAFDKKTASKIKIETLADLKPFGLDMRVIGSQNPILCFSFPAEDDISPVRCLKRQEAKQFFEKELRNE